jgi:hypothetical protein
MCEFAVKHGPYPPATGLLKPTLTSSLDNSMKRGIVECPLDIQEGTQSNLLMIQRLFLSVNNLEKSCFCRHTCPIGKLVPVWWFFNQSTAPDMSIK